MDTGSEGVRPVPPTRKGVRTRKNLIVAARKVFERGGFIDTRLADITAEAGCSPGTFYTYFDSKEEIFAAVVASVQEDMLNPGMPRLGEGEADAMSVIEASNRAYFEAYKRNTRLNMLFEQVSMIDPKFRELRRLRGNVFNERNAKSLKALQDAGLVDADLDPFMTAAALGGMVSRLAYQSFALGEDWPMEKMVKTGTRIWARVLGLEDGSDRTRSER